MYYFYATVNETALVLTFYFRFWYLTVPFQDARYMLPSVLLKFVKQMTKVAFLLSFHKY